MLRFRNSLAEVYKVGHCAAKLIQVPSYISGEMIALIVVALFGCAFADLPDDGRCGNPTINPIFGNSKTEDGRIVGGREVIPYSWPWQTQVRYSGSHYCGASLISPGK